MNQNELKKAAAERAVSFVQEGRVLGVGTGSTVDFFIDALAASGKKVPACVSSSVRSTEHLERLGFKVLDPNEVDEIEVYVDGADEIDSGFHMVKGGGGALTREKILASLARTYVCIADESKLVPVLGRFPLPVEVIPMAVGVFREAGMKEEVKNLSDSLFGLLSSKEKFASRYWVVYEELKYSDLFAPRFKFFVENRGEIAGKKYEEVSFKIICTMLSDHLINNTTGRITSKENPWNCGDANEMPYMRSLIKMSDLRDKEFFLVWCDLAEACYFGQADQVKEYIRKMTILPEAIEFGRSFVWAFQQYFPDEKEELIKLRELWNLDEDNCRK